MQAGVPGATASSLEAVRELDQAGRHAESCSLLADASRPREGMLATSLGIGTLLFAAIGVVVQLKDALNTVWEVQAAWMSPRPGG